MPTKYEKAIQGLSYMAMASATASTVSDQKDLRLPNVVLGATSLVCSILMLILTYLENQEKAEQKLISIQSLENTKNQYNLLLDKLNISNNNQDEYLKYLQNISDISEEIEQLFIKKTIAAKQLSLTIAIEKCSISLTSFIALLSIILLDEDLIEESLQVAGTCFFSFIAILAKINSYSKESSMISIKDTIDELNAKLEDEHSKITIAIIESITKNTDSHITEIDPDNQSSEYDDEPNEIWFKEHDECLLL